jgi:hypothetical protein
MTFQTDSLNAEMLRQQDAANTNLTPAEVAIRYHRRRLLAATNNAGSVNSEDVQALKSFGIVDSIPINDVQFSTNKTAFEAALAVLVADGASPTQAHVTTANTAYTTHLVELAIRHSVKADKVAFEAALAVLVADGASPTQAHVTTANNAYTTFKGGVI